MLYEEILNPFTFEDVPEEEEGVEETPAEETDGKEEESVDEVENEEV